MNNEYFLDEISFLNLLHVIDCGSLYKNQQRLNYKNVKLKFEIRFYIKLYCIIKK
jgi:hypothetical protein